MARIRRRVSLILFDQRAPFDFNCDKLSIVRRPGRCNKSRRTFFILVAHADFLALLYIRLCFPSIFRLTAGSVRFWTFFFSGSAATTCNAPLLNTGATTGAVIQSISAQMYGAREEGYAHQAQVELAGKVVRQCGASSQHHEALMPSGLTN